MSKIICDVCGTSYHETATQCPICGCVRPVETVTVNTENTSDEVQAKGTYTYVKGGRFSKANVKKRNAANHAVPVEQDFQNEPSEENKQKSDKGLLVAIWVLLLAIIAVVIYIVMHFFAPGFNLSAPTDPIVNQTTEATTENTTEASAEASTDAEIHCTDIVISNSVIELDKVGAAQLLNVTVDPEDSTDEIVFTSSDEAVATVSADGKVVAVGPGQTLVTVSCGEIEAECRVVCTFETVPEETTNPITEPTVSSEDFKLNREDFTMNRKGDTWLLYKGEIPVKQIIWTSDNEKVVTIQDGVVTAVGSGMTTIYGEYNGKKVSCVVRCSPAVGKYEETPAETQNPDSGDYNISSTDITLYLNGVKSFELKLLDAEKKPVDVIWSVADAAVCAVDGNTVTGLSAGTTKVSVTYEGETYSCIVRVRNS